MASEGLRRRSSPARKSTSRKRDRNAWDAWLERAGPRIEDMLETLLPPAQRRPQSIHRAMRYAVFSGGKRIRPGLTQVGFELAGGRGSAGLRTGAAIELIHTFSLIHDDLPCMDDDALRRGRPTCHRKFGEATAVLAGDALQVLAFEALADLPTEPATTVRVIAEITRAVGTAGVIGGQVVDIESEGRRVPIQRLRWIHAHKTGALLRCALVSGALAAGARTGLRRRLTRFGDAFGLLFQIVDDALNEVGSARVLGREQGGDRNRGKATYPSVVGLDGTRRRIGASLQACLAALPGSAAENDIFRGLLETVVARLPGRWSEPLLDETGLR